jgi:hypothetical protein
VLALVVADRHLVGLVEEDVAGHQNWIGEEACGHRLLALPLVLELCHPAKLADRGHGAEQPGGLRVGGDVALHEDGGALGVDSGREEHRGEVEGRLAQRFRVVRNRDRVQVDDAEERLAQLLGGRILAKAAAVVAEVLRARGLDPREDTHD